MNNKKSRTLSMPLLSIHTFFILYCLACLIPFLLVIAISLTGEAEIQEYGYRLIPKHFNPDSYKYIFEDPWQLVNSYTVTIFFTAVGTVLSVMIMSLVAYPLSRNSFKFRRQLMFYFYFTMLFSGGLVPTYILISKYLHLGDTIWVYIFPGLVNAWHIIILRTFFQRLPESIFESAKIDGAGEFMIYLRFAMPLSKPAIATVALFGVLARWNDWYTSLLYINNEKLFSLQYLLQKILIDLQVLKDNMDKIPQDVKNSMTYPGESMRMAMCILSAGPIVIVFPFFQKYFVSGLTVGSVKG